MKEKDKFRYAEKCLYDYKKNMACLEILRDDLKILNAGTDVHAQNYQYTFSFSGEPSNPVQARIIKIEAVKERIQKLERFTKPITQLIENLNAPEVLNGSDNKMLMEILRLMYFGKNLPDMVIGEMNIARRTFFNYRRELVYLTIDYLAL